MKKLWDVVLSREARKQYEKLKMSGRKRPCLVDLIDAFVNDLIFHGPILNEWANFGLINLGPNSFYHCHLKKGRPMYVACWRVTSEKERKMEVFYVGTHESAPY